MKLTKAQYRFKPLTLVNDVYDLGREPVEMLKVARRLAQRGFNIWEAEALIRTNMTYDLTIEPRSSLVNGLVMKVFGKEHKLELNENGVPCKRGTMPGNYNPNKTILVPLGTPNCCDPTSETYWSM